MSSQLSILSWNVRGLNNQARRAVVRTMLDQLPCSIVCLQESKLADVADSDILEITGSDFDCHSYLAADGTRGGILLCWRSSCFSATAIMVRTFSITAVFTPVGQNTPWTLTTIYGP